MMVKAVSVYFTWAQNGFPTPYFRYQEGKVWLCPNQARKEHSATCTAHDSKRDMVRSGDVDSPRSFTCGVRPIFSEQKPTLPNGRAPTTLDRE